MLKAQIKVGGFYKAKVSDKIVTVRVDSITEREGTKLAKATTVYGVTNMTTGRTTVFRSAAKFRGEAADPGKAKSVVVPVEVETALRTDSLGKLLTAALKPSGGQQGGPAYSPAEKAEADAIHAKMATLPAPSGLAAALRKPGVTTDTAPHIIIVARAGTGKTTTLIGALQCLKGMPPTDARGNILTPSPQQKAVWDAVCESRGKASSVCFTAFNSSIAKELQTRVPAGYAAMTMHALGSKAVRRMFPNIRVLDDGTARVNDIIARLLGKDIRDLRRDQPVLVAATRRLVSLCKMNLIGLEAGTPLAVTTAALGELADYYDIELADDKKDYREQVYNLVPDVLNKCLDVRHDLIMDFDDMIWLPVALDLPVDKYDLLLVDEAQDLNRCQQALARKAGRRLVFCGDPRQAIYGFAGADAESMTRLGEELKATDRGCLTLPLTVTRRCGKAIVAEAKKIVADFEAHESNPAGSVSTARRKVEANIAPATGAWPYQQLARDGDMVLCRCNAPLVSECFRFIKAGRKANIQGRNIGKGLIDLIERMKANSVAELVAKVDDWRAHEVQKEQAKRNPSEAKVIGIEDKADCVICFTEGSLTVYDVIRKINDVFTDDKDKPGIRLSSIHKAKGLEAHRVFLLQLEGACVPHPMAKAPWEVEQEMNLKYVAVTRAIDELVYVS